MGGHEMAGTLRVKPGTTFAYHPAGFRILEAVRATALKLDIDVTITSGSDGLHSGPSDPHHSGEAYDLRTKDLPQPVKVALLAGIRDELGEDEPNRRFYTFLEAPGTSNEHLHCQRRKGTSYSMLDYLNR